LLAGTEAGADVVEPVRRRRRRAGRAGEVVPEHGDPPGRGGWHGVGERRRGGRDAGDRDAGEAAGDQDQGAEHGTRAGAAATREEVHVAFPSVGCLGERSPSDAGDACALHGNLSILCHGHAARPGKVIAELPHATVGQLELEAEHLGETPAVTSARAEPPDAPRPARSSSSIPAYAGCRRRGSPADQAFPRPAWRALTIACGRSDSSSLVKKLDT